MASGKMCLREQEEITEWTELFPTGVISKQESATFVKRMVAVAVSAITYLRGIFPEKAYKARYMEDICIKILRETSTTTGANKVVKWLVGCFDALDKQYLQMVFIGVYTTPGDSNSIIESYQFNFRYTDKGPEFDIVRNNNRQDKTTAEETKKAFIILIRKLYLLMQNLECLPENVYLTMKLYYYEITPEEYQPPGFKEGVFDSLWFSGIPVQFKMGTVRTPFHTLKLRMAVEQRRLGKFHQGAQLLTDEKLGAVETPEVLPKKLNTEQTPTGDESAQFKKPTEPACKRIPGSRCVMKKKRRN